MPFDVGDKLADFRLGNRRVVPCVGCLIDQIRSIRKRSARPILIERDVRVVVDRVNATEQAACHEHVAFGDNRRKQRAAENEFLRVTAVRRDRSCAVGASESHIQ